MNSTTVKIVKRLAECGYGSRRACEELIDHKRVTLNGSEVKRGDRMSEDDDLRVDGQKVKQPQKETWMINKPKGTLCTDSKRRDETRLIDHLPASDKRLYAVGRLDKDFEGLMLFTNDGELCNRLTHPRYRIEKKYEVRVRGRVEKEHLQKISKGLHLSDGKTPPVHVHIKRSGPQRTILHFTLFETRKRLIPRLLAHFDYGIDRVQRISIGPLTMKNLKPGQSRRLTSGELKQLEKLVSPHKKLSKKSNKKYNSKSIKKSRSSKRKKT